nr:hypothetical protein [Tanacetum cinerariifolium]
NGVACVQQGQVNGAVGLGAGVWLNVGVIGAEQLFGAVDGQLLNDVDVFAAAVVTLAWVTFGVLVAAYRSESYLAIVKLRLNMAGPRGSGGRKGGHSTPSRFIWHMKAGHVPDERNAVSSHTLQAERVSLHFVAAVFAQEFQLFVGFHALRDDRQVEAVGHGDDRAGDLCVLFAGRQTVDEGAVDLQHIDRELLEVVQRGIAGAEVVDRDAQAQALEAVQDLHRFADLAHQDAFARGAGRFPVPDAPGRWRSCRLDRTGSCSCRAPWRDTSPCRRSSSTGSARCRPAGSARSRYWRGPDRGTSRPPRHAGARRVATRCADGPGTVCGWAGGSGRRSRRAGECAVRWPCAR